MLKGYKTYIIGALIFIVGGLMAVHIIPKDLGELIIIFLGGLGGIALRAGIKNSMNGG